MHYPKWFKQIIKRDVDNLSESVMLGNDIPPLEEVEAFTRNGVWKYISDTIDFRIKSARDDMEDQKIDIETLRVFQGRIEELRFIGDLPTFIIDTYTQLKDEIAAKKAAEDEDEPKKEDKSWTKN